MPAKKYKRPQSTTKCAPAIWKKLTPIERELWIHYYTLLSWEVNFPPEWQGKEFKKQREVTAHNMACEAVWCYQNMLFAGLAKGFTQ